MSDDRGGTKRVISNSVIYSLSGLLLKCFSFFLLPLYTTYLTTSDYGVTNIANSFLSTMGFFVAFSLYSAIMRFYVDLKEDEQQLKRFYGTIIIFVFLSSFVTLLFCTLLKDVLSKYIFLGVEFWPIIFVSLISLVFNCQHTIYDNILRSQQRAMECSILTISYFFIQVSLNIFFIVYYKLGALGVLLSTAISGGVYTIYFIYSMYTNKEVIFCLDFKILKDALRYSIPIIPHNLSTYIASLVSSVLIGNVSTVAALGVYSIAVQFGNIADTIQGYVNNAYAPWLYQKLHDREFDYKENIRKIVNVLVTVIGLFLIGISLFAQDYIIVFLDKSYIDSWIYVPLIVSVYTIKIIYYFYVNVLFYYKKAAKILFVSTLTGSFINVLLSAFFIPKYGIYGSLLADAIAMIVRVGIVVYISKQFENIGLYLTDFFKHIFIIFMTTAIGLSLSYFWYANYFSFVNFVFKISVVIIYIVVYSYLYHEYTTIFMRKVRKILRIN